MIRFLNIYYPLRALMFLTIEALVVFSSLLFGRLLQLGKQSDLLLNSNNEYYKLLIATIVLVVFCHWFEFYDVSEPEAKGKAYFRLVGVLSLVALTFALLQYLSPKNGRLSSIWGLSILALTLLGWRRVYVWLTKQPYLRQRVHVLGSGERAQNLVSSLQNSDLGIDVVGWTAFGENAPTRDVIVSRLVEVARQGVERVIVALPDRRGALPVQELLQLKLSGIKVEEAATWLEKIHGRIELEYLYPSWLILADGFCFSGTLNIFRRALSILASTVLLVLVLPLLPLVVLAIKLDSAGPVLYKQERVGRRGTKFFCYKFRTMRRDAEADTGPTWARDDDPRITRVGRILRLSRIDEIPQLWNVLKGDMSFVGPRPEREEFADWLSKQIPYYSARHAVRPGITGWAQIRYRYGNTVEDAKEKLQYDLYYIKNASMGLDLLIMFRTIKIVLLGRGAK
jgi:sugar transferase (PEP-CTERM system associated)